MIFEEIRDLRGYIINLDRYPERYREAAVQLESLGFSNIHRWSAADNSKEDLVGVLQKLGVPTDTFNRPAEIGCALSHIRALEDFLTTSEEYCLIFEDDIVVHSKFLELFLELKPLQLNDIDILFLGGWFWSARFAEIEYKQKDILVELGGSPVIENATCFETHAYLASRNFAEYFLRIYRTAAPDESRVLDNFYVTNIQERLKSYVLGFSPYTSDNLERIRVRDSNTCGLVFQREDYESSIQLKVAPEVAINKKSTHWLEYEKAETYTFDRASVNIISGLNRKAAIPSSGLLTVPGGKASSSGIVLDSDGRFIPETSWAGPVALRDGAGSLSLSSYRRGLREGKNATDIKSGRALYMNHEWASSNYGHYVLSFLTKIEMVEKLLPSWRSDFDWICLPKAPFQLHQQLLEKLEIPASKIIELVPEDNWLKFEEVVVPTPRGTGRYSRRGSFRYLRKLFGLENVKPFRKLYISRTEGLRRILNEDELIERLEPLGFEVVIPHEEKANTLKLFNEAAIVLGVHGSGLVDCAFSQQGSRLIEILPSFHVLPYYLSVADAAGMDYIGHIHKVRRSRREPYKLNLPILFNHIRRSL